MTTKVKVIVSVVVVVVVAVIIYFMFKGATPWTFTENPQKDIAGSDISNESNVTLEQAKAKAQKLNAAAFVYYPNEKRAWYKSSAASMTNGWNPGTYSTYVHDTGK